MRKVLRAGVALAAVALARREAALCRVDGHDVACHFAEAIRARTILPAASARTHA